jgi:transposase-like protein
MLSDTSEGEGLRVRLADVETESVTLQQSLAELHLKLRCAEEDKENLSKMTQELNRELGEVKTTVESSTEIVIEIELHGITCERDNM